MRRWQQRPLEIWNLAVHVAYTHTRPNRCSLIKDPFTTALRPVRRRRLGNRCGVRGAMFCMRVQTVALCGSAVARVAARNVRVTPSPSAVPAACGRRRRRVGGRTRSRWRRRARRAARVRHVGQLRGCLRAGGRALWAHAAARRLSVLAVQRVLRSRPAQLLEQRQLLRQRGPRSSAPYKYW